MLFKRYANPLDLMRTFDLEGLADFILDLFDVENEEQLWETWLHKPIEKDFATFKKDHYKKQRKTKHKVISAKEEKANIEQSMRFIKPRQEGGD